MVKLEIARSNLISKLLNGHHPQESLNFACASGALVAKNKGANPVISEVEIDAIMNQDLP